MASALIGSACGDEGSPSHVLDAGIDVATLDAEALDAAAAHAQADAAPSDGALSSPCPLTPGSCDDAPLPRFRTLLRASDYGASARFVAMSGYLVLVDDGQRSSVLRLQPDTEQADGAVEVFPLPDGQRGRDLAGNRYVLVCAADDSCALWALDDVLAPVETHGLPTDVRVDGIAQLDGIVESSAWPCVFGSSLACFHDAAWTPALASVAADDAVLQASARRVVTRRGRWFQRGVDEATAVLHADYDELESLPIDAGTLHADEGSCAWNDQQFWCVDGPARDTCSLAVGVRAAFSPEDGRLGILTGTGELLLRDFDRTWCRVQSDVALTEPVIDVAHETCFPHTSFRALTAHELVGESFCRSFL